MAIKEKDLPVSGSYGPGVYVRTVSASGASQKTGFAAMKEALDPTVDSALSTSSTNPVQNKVITGAVNDLKEDIHYAFYNIDTINNDLYDDYQIYVDYKIGRYYTDGYISYPAYMYSVEKLPAGSYHFPAAPNNFKFAIVKYISDVEGQIVIGFRTAAIDITLTDPCILVFNTIDNSAITTDMIISVKDAYAIIKDTGHDNLLNIVNAVNDTVNDITDIVVGVDNPVIDLDLVQGYYDNNGFGGSTSTQRWRTRNAMPGGTYLIEVLNSDYMFYWTKYVSDSEGVPIINGRNTSILHTDNNDFYFTFIKYPLTSITPEEIKNAFRITQMTYSTALEARVNRLYSTQNVVFMGDSLFGLERGHTSIPNLCAGYTGATTLNCAIGGSTARERNDNYTYYSFEKLVDAIISSNFANQIAHQSDSGYPSYLPEVISTLQSIDFSDINIVVISYGTNDWNMETGTNSEIIETIKSNINKMLQNFPDLRFLVMTPTYRFWVSGDTFENDSDTRVNGNNETLKNLVNMFDTVNEDCHTPVVYAYYDLGINRYNRGQWFITNDTTHPNETGRKETAKLISEKLKTLLYN